MLNSLKTRNKEQGFTIIEVLIVLAIAGLILLVVFLAVPALQRNQRNSARRAEAGQVASAATDQLTNSNANMPTQASDMTSILKASGVQATGDQYAAVTSYAAGTGAANTGYANLCKATDAANNTGTVCSVNNVSPTNTVSFSTTLTGDALVLVEAGQCGTSGNTVNYAGTRNLALVYTIETSGNGRNYACLNVQ